MSRSDHSKKPRHLTRVRREGSTRTTTRQAIHNGDWDNMPTSMPTRAIRRPLNSDGE